MDIVGTVDLSKASEIIFYTDVYKGDEFANIRKFVKSEKYTGPTKSGIKLNKEQLHTICGILARAPRNLEKTKDEELGKIKISENLFIWVGFTYFKGQYGLDIRQYLKTEKYTGPSKKGIRIPLDYIDATVGYCERMLALIGNSKQQEVKAEKQENPSIQKVAIDKNKDVEGVPDEYQKYF